MDLLTDLLIGIITSAQVAALPPPMTQAEVRAQVLYTDDCVTTRSGVTLTCQAAFIHDLDHTK